MPENLNPPSAWRQRVRFGLPFVPGRDGERFEIHVVDEPGEPRRIFEISTSTAEVFERRAHFGFDAPPWSGLPPAVQRAVLDLLGPSEERFPR